MRQGNHGKAAGFETLLLVLILGLATGCMAGARMMASDSPGTNANDLIARGDQDGDDALSTAELRALRDDLFDRFDRNGDGYLSADDSPQRPRIKSRFEQRLARIQTTLDTDGDDRISRDEFVDGALPAMEAHDANADGRLDATELSAALETLR
jgi:hypothetical protein